MNENTLLTQLAFQGFKILISVLQGNLVAWKQSSMRTLSQDMIVYNVTVQSMLHAYRASVCNFFGMPNRHQLCRWFLSLHMTKIMHMEMLNVEILMRPERQLVMIDVICLNGTSV
jgi:hypothetical protein